MQTEKQVHRHILSQKIPEGEIVAVLQTMSVMNSGKHSAVAKSLTSWFQRQTLYAPVKQKDEKTKECDKKAFESDIVQRPLSSDAGMSNECSAPALGCRHHSSDMSGMTACLGTTGGRCAEASNPPQQDGQQGISPSDGTFLSKDATSLPADVSAALPLITGSIPCVSEQHPAKLVNASWDGVPPTSCLEEDDSMFEGLFPLEGIYEGPENGIDVRNLWAGGNALEASSDGTMLDQQTFIDSESVTEAILDFFKDPEWQKHDPPDEPPSSFASILQPVVAPQTGNVMQCEQVSAAGFVLDTVQSINDAQPASCWNETECAQGSLQAWDNSAKAHASGPDNRISGVAQQAYLVWL